MTDGGADLVIEAAGHASSLAIVFDYARAERSRIDGRHQHRPEVPGRTGQDPDQNLTCEAASVRPASGRRRSASSNAPALIFRRSRRTRSSWTMRMAALELGVKPHEAIKITLEIA